MPSLMQLKTFLQDRLRPLCDFLDAHGVTPNALTTLTLFVSVAVGTALAFLADHPRAWLCLPPWLLLRILLNTIDGMIAREHHRKTPLGALLNEVADAVCEAALLLPFALCPGISPVLVVLLVVLSLCGEVAGLAALLIGAPRRYDGPLAKPDRAVIFTILSIALGVCIPAGTWTSVLLLSLLALALLTGINRVRGALAYDKD